MKQSICIVPTQMRAQRRRKSGSVRTESECSDGRGTMVDIEMASQTDSLRRGRSRMDSAYMSTDVSDPFSSGLEGVDEDHYGYVLPTERGKPILQSFCLVIIGTQLCAIFIRHIFSFRFQKHCTSW